MHVHYRLNEVHMSFPELACFHSGDGMIVFGSLPDEQGFEPGVDHFSTRYEAVRKSFKPIILKKKEKKKKKLIATQRERRALMNCS